MSIDEIEDLHKAENILTVSKLSYLESDNEQKKLGKSIIDKEK